MSHVAREMYVEIYAVHLHCKFCFVLSSSTDANDCLTCTIHQFFKSGSDNPKAVYEYMMANARLASTFPRLIESDPCELMQVSTFNFLIVNAEYNITCV